MIGFLGLCVLLTVAMIGVAWAVVESNDGFDLNGAVRKGVDSAIADATKPGGVFDQAIMKAFCEEMTKTAHERRSNPGSLNRIQFGWEVAFEFIRVGNMAVIPARDLAGATVRQMLAEEKIAYGDPRYAWDQEAARTIAHEMELDHWENRP